MLIELLITLTVTLVVYLYIKCKSTYSYFTDRGIKNVPPVPDFGNLWKAFLTMKNGSIVYNTSVYNSLQQSYNTFPSERIMGVFELVNSAYVIRDPDLIKQIIVKDFDHFMDHRCIFSEQTDQLFANNLMSLKGDKWRKMRSALSPAFTGSKMRNMCPSMVECGQQVIDYLKNECKTQKSGDGLDVEMKDLFTRFATNVIASSAFGCKVNSLVERDNEFFTTGTKMSSLTNWQILKTLIFVCLPKVARFLKLRIFHPSVTTFFQSIFNTIVKYREENKVFKPDVINILMDINKGSLKYETNKTTDGAGFGIVQESEIGKQHSKTVWTKEELASQTSLFFLAGFDTISIALSFTTMELALNSDIQDKLRAEVDAKYPEDGNLTYDSIKEMEYLDMVISESLRAWTPMPLPDRMCVKTYQVPGENGGKSTITIEKGMTVLIPAYAIHHDPKYWEEPNKFNPERFSAENKHKIRPYTYLPFGVGPRNCIGSRFGLMEMKIILFYIIKHFKLVPGPKTANPLVLNNDSFVMSPKDGFRLKMFPRDDIK